MNKSDEMLKNIPRLVATPVAVTPEIAEGWLENKEINRAINHRRVFQYAREMERGAWWPVSMVVFDEDGRLIDGEHRLRAIVKCGKTVTLLVLRGVDKKWRGGIDMGQTRQVAQCLHMFHGMPNAAVLSATVKTVLSAKLRDTLVIPSVDEVFEEYNANKADYDAAALIHGRCRKAGLPINAGFAAGVFFVLKLGVEDEHGRVIFDDFVNKIITGEELKKGSPCLAIRSAILRPKHSPTRNVTFSQASWVLKAWEDFVCANERNMFKEVSSPWFDFLASYDRLKEIHDTKLRDVFGTAVG